MLLRDLDNVPSLPGLTRLLRATQNQRPLSCLDMPDAGESKLYSLGAESVTFHGQNMLLCLLSSLSTDRLGELVFVYNGYYHLKPTPFTL
jgi:hypothetical protein